MIQLDTHVVAWLFAGELERIPKSAAKLIEDNSLQISPMVELELQYLFEVNRTADPAAVVLRDLLQKIGLDTVSIEYQQVIAEAVHLSWTRDPFDRLITATAIATNTSLLTADASILEHCELALWK